MRRQVLSDKGKVNVDDFNSEFAGLHYPLWYVLRTWAEHRNHNVYPAPGGFDDQDPALVLHDWSILNERYNYWHAEISENEDAHNASDDLIREGEIPDNTPGINRYFG